MTMIDLHTHTTASDGSLTFEELVHAAKAVGLSAIAITDHDTLESARRISRKEPLEVIPGIELSVFDSKLGYSDIHILGLFIDPRSVGLNSKLEVLKTARERQKIATVDKLRSMGYDITFEEVRAKAAGTVGRPHIAQVLVEKYPKEFPNVASVFEKLLGNGKPAYIGREEGFSLKEAISLIHSAGGYSFLAHPFMYQYDIDRLVSDFESQDGDGLEVYYDYIRNRPEIRISEAENEELIAHMEALAKVGGFMMSGGSDFHGKSKGQRLGEFGAPDELLLPMKRDR